jgi:XTP/dITP diphosphohydrolase
MDKNIDLVLEKLQGKADRNARFKTIISLFVNGEQHFFEGTVEGRIINERTGTEGFGYDPIFIPNGYEKTFAEMSLEEKNKISHRSQAVAKLVGFLNNYNR